MSYKIEYFKLYGRADPLRLMLKHAGKDFENVEVEFPDWPAKKPSMVGGSMPNLTLPDGTVLGHSTISMLRMLGTEFGYYPTDPIAAYNCDFLMDLH